QPWLPAKARLPDVATGAVMLLVAADLRRQQPQHVIAQLALTPWPDGKVEMIRHQTKGEYKLHVRTLAPASHRWSNWLAGARLTPSAPLEAPKAGAMEPGAPITTVARKNCTRVSQCRQFSAVSQRD